MRFRAIPVPYRLSSSQLAAVPCESVATQERAWFLPERDETLLPGPPYPFLLVSGHSATRNPSFRLRSPTVGGSGDSWREGGSIHEKWNPPLIFGQNYARSKMPTKLEAGAFQRR